MKLKVLNEKKDDLLTLTDQTDYCIKFVENALAKGSDNAVLYCKRTLTNHLQSLKSQRADIPNPDIPVRMVVQLNQAVEICKVVSQLGMLLVDGKPYPPPPSPAQAHSPILTNQRMLANANAMQNQIMANQMSIPPVPAMTNNGSPNNPSPNSGYPNGQMFNNNSPQPQFSNMQMNRSFQEGNCFYRKFHLTSNANYDVF